MPSYTYGELLDTANFISREEFARIILHADFSSVYSSDLEISEEKVLFTFDTTLGMVDAIVLYGISDVIGDERLFRVRLARSIIWCGQLARYGSIPMNMMRRVSIEHLGDMPVYECPRAEAVDMFRLASL